MKKVLLRGPSLVSSGYGQHTRMIGRWLLSKHNVDLRVQALPWGNCPWIIDSKQPAVSDLMVRTAPADCKQDVTVQVQLPSEWDSSLGYFNIGVTAAVETDRCNPEWVTACNKVQHVIVPSEHTKNVLASSGKLTTPISVVPESYPDCFRSESLLNNDILSLDFDAEFNFLIFGQITGNNAFNDRKNTFFTLRWLCEVFKDDHTTGIVLKTNMGRNTKIDRRLTLNMLNQLINEIRPNSKFPKIHLIHGDLSDEEVFSLYRHPQVKALVSLTRGEGFGLPTLEAAVAGLPVVATNWSGHLDFMNLGKFVKVDYELKEIHSSRVDNTIFVKGAKWAEPIESDFKRKIVKLRNSYAVPKEWALALKTQLLKSHSHENISATYNQLFSDVF